MLSFQIVVTKWNNDIQFL